METEAAARRREVEPSMAAAFQRGALVRLPQRYHEAAARFAEAVASEGRAGESEVSNETDEADEALSRAGTRELSPVLGLPAETSAAC